MFRIWLLIHRYYCDIEQLSVGSRAASALLATSLRCIVCWCLHCALRSAWGTVRIILFACCLVWWSRCTCSAFWCRCTGARSRISGLNDTAWHQRCSILLRCHLGLLFTLGWLTRFLLTSHNSLEFLATQDEWYSRHMMVFYLHLLCLWKLWLPRHCFGQTWPDLTSSLLKSAI